MKCRNLNYDDQIFGKASINLVIAKFREKRRINMLNAFSLRYYSNEQEMKVQLVECDRKFVFLLRAHHRHCRDTTFYIKNEESIKFFVDNRIILNAAFFWKINSNYIRSQPHKMIKKKINNNEFFDAFSKSSSERILD